MAGAPSLEPGIFASGAIGRRTPAGDFIAKQKLAPCGLARERKTTQNYLGAIGVGANCARELVHRADVPVACAQQSGDCDRHQFCRIVFLDFVFILEQCGRVLLALEKLEKVCRHRTTQRERNPATDRKSTRLNSSHPSISYAVFCLKKK